MYTILEWLELQQRPTPTIITDPSRLIGRIAPDPDSAYRRAVREVMGYDPAPPEWQHLMKAPPEQPADYKPWTYCEKCRGRSSLLRHPAGFRVTCLHCHGRTVTTPSFTGRGPVHTKPYGGSWHSVKGQRASSMTNRNAQRFRAFIRQVDKQCKENPSPTFRFKAADCKRPGCTAEEQRYGSERRRGGQSDAPQVGKPVRSIDDAMVQLQLLGVTV